MSATLLFITKLHEALIQMDDATELQRCMNAAFGSMDEFLRMRDAALDEIKLAAVLLDERREGMH